MPIEITHLAESNFIYCLLYKSVVDVDNLPSDIQY